MERYGEVIQQIGYMIPTSRFSLYIPLIEKFLLAEDRKGFIEGLPKDGTDKAFLRLCTEKLDWESYQKLVKQLGIGRYDEEKLQKFNALSILLDESCSNSDRDKAINLFKEQMNFDYVKPTTAATITQNSQNQTKLPSELKPEDYSLDKFISTFNYPGFYAKINEYGLSKLSKDKILNLAQTDFDSVIKNYCFYRSGRDGLQILKKYIEVKRSRDANFQLHSQLYRLLTTEQVQQLPNYISGVQNTKQYISWRYKKTFGYQISSQFPCNKNNIFLTKQQLKQKKQLIQKARNWLKDLKLDSILSFIDGLTIQLLTLNILLQQPELELFFEYLKRPRDITSEFSESYQNDLKLRRQTYVFDTYWNQVHSFNCLGSWPSDENLFEDYLSIYFKQKSQLDSIKIFEPYFKREYLLKFLIKIKLQKGEEIPDLHTIFTKDQEIELKNKKQLTISEKNKNKFKVNEEISLKLFVKNIQEITADIYEISTEKHYLHSKKEIDDSISLEFLVPFKKVTKKIDNQSPFKVNEIDFSLTEHLEAKSSIYIVDFQGQGILSRAVIRRGSIVTFTKPTLAGVELRFFQEDGTTINQLDIWLRGRKIHVKDKYTIPYGQQPQNVDIIVVKNEYAELFRTFISKQQYNWTISYTYHQENFLVGSKAKVLLNAKLRSNSGVISLAALKDTTITVNILNHLDIPATLSFSGIKWDSKNEYQLQIPIQSYLKKIDIFVSAKVDKYVGKPQELTSQQTITFRQTKHSLSFLQFFLSSTTQGFILRLLGKNGQPKPFVSLTINIKSRLVKNQISTNVMTDENGQVKLGNLKDVQKLNASNIETADMKAVTTSWNLDFISQQVSNNTDEIYLNDGEEFSLPVYRGFNLQTDVSLLKAEHSHGVLSNETSKLKYDGNRIFGKLQKGSYVLIFLALQRKIQISVNKLSNWGNSKYLINNQTNQIYSLPSTSKSSVYLSNNFDKTSQTDSNKISLKLQCQDKTQLNNIRVHILASTFIYKNNYTEQIFNTTSNNPIIKQFLKNNTCSYLNNKELSDERCYVQNRQKQDKFIGNNLERPRVLLKRTFNKDTTQKKQQLNQQLYFSKRIINKGRQNLLYCSKRKKGGHHEEQTIEIEEGISSFNNFLKYPSIIIPNLHGESLEFDLPKVYQSFTVIVASPNFVYQKLYSFQKNSYETNNLVNSGLKDSNTKEAYTISRQAYKLQVGQTLKVNRSSQWTSVSGSNLSILSQITNTKLHDWVNNWPSYSYEKKLQVYDQNVCHELNTYIKYKDTQFFEKIVKPFISNKLQKGIVDYCLLEDKQAEKYTRLQQYSELNAFEKCLLVQYLIKNKQNDKAKSIIDALSQQLKALKVPFSEFENKFDIIMTSKQISKSIQTSADELKKIEILKNINAQIQSMKYQQCNDMMCQMEECCLQACYDQYQCQDNSDREQKQLQERKQFKSGFEEIQKTKEYVETTYHEMKNPLDSINHIPLSKFWVQLAQFFLNPQNSFLSQSFIYLSSKQELSLAVAFLPLPLVAKYNIRSDGEFLTITAESPFMIFVKEIKNMQFQSKYGVLISQKISDPTDEFIYEDDGTALDKPVNQFIKDKPYYLNTIVTNTSTANLQLQVLIDIPTGSIPLGSNQTTTVISKNISSYQTLSFQRVFYFPQSGTFNLYPANASKNRQVISKATVLQPIIVKDIRQSKKLETLNDVLISGNKSDILNFLQTKNIFDTTIFNVDSILWLLKDKDMFNQVSGILKTRFYPSTEILEFGFLHKDSAVIKQFIDNLRNKNSSYQNVLEYYPLTSHRAHKFMKQQKSTILNETFSKTYESFLIGSMFEGNIEKPLFLIVFSYYLIRQDRVKQGYEIFKTLSKLIDNKDFPKIQYDYLACFIDIYVGYPNFVVARDISSKYVNYPVITWQKLFKQVDQLLNTHDTTVFEENVKEQHDIRISIKGNRLSVILPQKTTVEINLHAVNIELMFSNSPFEEAKLFSSVRPFKTIIVTSEKGGQQFIERPPQHADIYVTPVQLSSTKQSQLINSFLWPNDSVKVKILQDQGVAIAFVDGKPTPKVYCKVYAKGKQTRFYKDGYTDIQGRFKYVSQLDDIQKFSLLFITQKGGITKTARPPTTNGLLI